MNAAQSTTAIDRLPDERGCSARHRHRARLALVCAVGVLAACATKYTLNTAQPGIALQWPYQPNPAKLIYVGSFNGLARNRNAGTLFKSIVLGAEEDSRDAFVLPVAVATGKDGRIAVADLGRRCVHLYISAQQRYLRLSGSEEEEIASPVGVIFDDELRLYLTDSSGKVFVFGPEGALLFTLHNAGAEALQRPTGLAYSPSKKLVYVVDTLANKVHAFVSGGAFAFSFGERGAGEGDFNFPTHIFRSSSGELYVTDSLNFRVAIFDEQGKPLGGFGHHGDGSGDLAMPKGLAVDKDGIIYVVDGLFDNVQLFDRQGQFLLTLGRRGTDFGEFWLPSGAFISGNDLYVCDTYNHRIQVFRITESYATSTS
jgi:DNA-binding beta-propeller fold protein YncE